MNPTVTRAQALDAVELVLRRHRSFDDNGRRMCRECLMPAPCATRRDVNQACGLEET